MRKPRDTRFPCNILLVGNWSSDVGYAWTMIERIWIGIAKAFPNRRTIICFPEVNAVDSDLVAAGVEIRKFDFDFRRPATLMRLCKELNIELIYLTDRVYSSAIYPLLRMSGVRHLIVHDHTPGQRTTPSAPKRLAKSAKTHVFGADAYIACSEHVLERLIAVACISPQKCHLARNGIDLSRFSQVKSPIRLELSLSPHTLLVVSCSRAHPYKRIGDIIDAAALVRDLDLHFIHIGDGPDFDNLQSRIQRLGLADQFRLLGRRNDVPEILSGCDIAVHASNGEVGLSLSILEFMASRLPVIVTDEPSVSRVIKPGETGMTFAHGDVESLADRLRILSGDPHLRRHLGEAARMEVDKHYRIEATISSVVRVLKQLDEE